MRQYLQLFWILGLVVACSGSNAGDGVTDAGPPTGAAGTAGAPTGGATNAAGTATSASSGGSVMAGGGATGSASGAPPNGGAAGANVSGASGANVSGASGAGAGGASAGGANAGGANSAGAGGGPAKKPDFKFPTPSGADQKLSKTMEVTDFDGKGARYIGTGDLGSGGQAEGQDPLFHVKAGGSLKNVILGAPAADGVHCEGSCTIDNVWWEDVGEDAITLLGSNSSNVYRISNSGARNATDKVIQHNGAGTVYVKNFLVESFGKLYRSCGNCSVQYQRHAQFDTILANGSKGELAGVNTKYQDSAKFANIFAASGMKICERYDGNDTGAEPSSVGVGADGTYCIYSATDISWH